MSLGSPPLPTLLNIIQRTRMTGAFEMGSGIRVKVPREGETESLLERDLEWADDRTWFQLSLR